MAGDGETIFLVGRWCSWCGKKTSHQMTERHTVRRSVFLCTSCEKHTVKCRAFCENMARAGADVAAAEIDDRDGKKTKVVKILKGYVAKNWDNEFCGEHNGTIPDFSKVNAKIKSPGEFKDLMKPRRWNLYSGTVKTLVVAGSAATGGLLGAGGSTAMALSRSALVAPSTVLSHLGLVRLGAGSFSTLAATRGATTGYELANSYLKDVPDYDFILKKSGESDHVVIFVNGFLSEGDGEALDWCRGLEGRFVGSSWWYLRWEGKNLLKLGQKLASLIVMKELSLGAGSNLSLINNPWHSAMLNAQKAGVLLAEMIARCESKRFTLMGHSLGGRVIHFALQALAKKGGPPLVDDAVLMGAAVGNTDLADWEAACSAVSGTLYNCYSRNDDVLRYIYRFANLWQSRPAGLSASEMAIANLVEMDFTSQILGHNEWKKNLPTVLQRLPMAVD